ncbi:hypothetical protein KILIM_079_00260 [Kineosphaera limosa NBRC 100340]|uniref:Uncharacterized protein n=1 Tax=Kineosphaera limosa NBRC 100340 TaxID=1184609 RepID=K6VNC9_9MICO|nr:hypothetical protein KILIM_079_00260 [Kineosphaera limosa NBRC 100340]
MEEHELVILDVVRISNGKSDTRNLDFAYYRRSSVFLDPHILHVLLEFEAQGLVSRVEIHNGTGPGWQLLPKGLTALKSSGWVS